VCLKKKTTKIWSPKINNPTITDWKKNYFEKLENAIRNNFKFMLTNKKKMPPYNFKPKFQQLPPFRPKTITSNKNSKKKPPNLVKALSNMLGFWTSLSRTRTWYHHRHCFVEIRDQQILRHHHRCPRSPRFHQEHDYRYLSSRLRRPHRRFFYW